MRALIDLETLLGSAIATRDLKILDRLSHPSFTYLGFHPGGMSAWTKGDWLKAVDATRTISFVHSTANVQVFQNAAVVAVDATWIGAGEDLPSGQQQLLMTDIWIKGSTGFWRLVRRHASTQAEVSAGAPSPVEAVLL